MYWGLAAPCCPAADEGPRPGCGRAVSPQYVRPRVPARIGRKTPAAEVFGVHNACQQVESRGEQPVSDAQSSISARWAKHGDKAKSAANPAYPDGVDVDLTEGMAPFCPVPLHYPAEEIGTWFIHCNTCGYTVAVTAAGSAGDPREVRIPCRAIGRPAVNA